MNERNSMPARINFYFLHSGLLVQGDTLLEFQLSPQPLETFLGIAAENSAISIVWECN